jgi:hypothetical protein
MKIQRLMLERRTPGRWRADRTASVEFRMSKGLFGELRYAQGRATRNTVSLRGTQELPCSATRYTKQVQPRELCGLAIYGFRTSPPRGVIVRLRTREMSAPRWWTCSIEADGAQVVSEQRAQWQWQGQSTR